MFVVWVGQSASDGGDYTILEKSLAKSAIQPKKKQFFVEVWAMADGDPPSVMEVDV